MNTNLDHRRFPTNYLYDGENIVEEMDSGGDVLARYTDEPRWDGPLSMLRSGVASYYEQDGLNSVASLTNSSGALAQSYTYDSYGKVTASTGALTNPFQYTGRELDSETGLLFYRARYVDPAEGRFINEDPIGFNGGNDFYSYVNNSPVSWIDPSGNAPCLDINNFVRALDHDARPPYGTGHCGHWVGWALTGNPNGHYPNGKDFGPYLLSLGFSEVSPDGYQPQAGDVAVVQPFEGGKPYGHVEGFDGTNWVSDYIQSSTHPPSSPDAIYPNRGYRTNKPQYALYRPTPCPTSPQEQSMVQRVISWVRSLFQ